MSQSSAIVQKLAVANLHQTSVRDLSLKAPQNFESRSILQAPRPFAFKVGSNLDTFSSLTLKDRLLSKKISGISQKRKIDTRSTITGKSTSENVQRIIPPESKKMKLKVASTMQGQEVPMVTSQKGVNKLELYRQGLEHKQHKETLAEHSQSGTSSPMKSAQDTTGVSDASLSAHKTKTSPRVLWLKLGCTFSKEVAPKHTLGIVRRQTDDVGNIDVKKKLQNERGQIANARVRKSR